MRICNNNFFLSKCQTTPNTIGTIQMFGSWLSRAQDCVHEHTNGYSKIKVHFLSTNEVAIVDYQS